MKCIKHALPTLAVATSILLAPICNGQVQQLIDFSAQSPGPGLDSLGNSFSGDVFTYGTSAVSGGNLANDSLVGVLAGSSSPLGSGNAGYIGGAGTQLNLTAAGGDLGLSIFPSSTSEAPVQVMNSSTPVISLNVDFAVQRTGGNANGQGFDFSIFDAGGPGNSGSDNFGLNSIVVVDPTNHVFTAANWNGPYVNTGITLANNTAYHLQTTVNYNSVTWSATLTQGNQSFNLVTDAPIDGGNYTLSGYTTPSAGWADIDMYATQASASNAAFADRLVFDNYTVTAVPEPSTYAAIIGAMALGFAVIRRKQAAV